MGAPLVFRLKQPPPQQAGSISPFTETPVELKSGWYTVGRVIRKIFNFLLLLILGLALSGLVLAFAYQMLHDPESLQAWGSSVIQTAGNLFHVLAGAVQ